MKKLLLASLFVVSATACSLINSNIGPKMVVTCEGVSDSITLTAQEATEFIKDVKNLNKDNPICLKDDKSAEFCINLLKASSKKCSAKAEL